jgi:hypothetical protein
MKLFIPGCFAILLLLVGCGKPKQSSHSLAEVKAMICGSYQGKYNKGVEYIIVREDGTFSQKFIQGSHVVYDHDGKWRFEKMDGRYLVTFEPFTDLIKAIMEGKSPESFIARTATFYDDEPDTIMFVSVPRSTSI